MWCDVSCQRGCEEVHRSHQLQGEDLQHVHSVWKLHPVWQRGRDGVCVEHRHRSGPFIKRNPAQILTVVMLSDFLISSGDQVAVYSELCYPTALHGVAFHPHENMVAFCAFGQSQPVHVYLYDRKGLFALTNKNTFPFSQLAKYTNLQLSGCFSFPAGSAQDKVSEQVGFRRHQNREEHT